MPRHPEGVGQVRLQREGNELLHLVRHGAVADHPVKERHLLIDVVLLGRGVGKDVIHRREEPGVLEAVALAARLEALCVAVASEGELLFHELLIIEEETLRDPLVAQLRIGVNRGDPKLGGNAIGESLGQVEVALRAGGRELPGEDEAPVDAPRRKLGPGARRDKDLPLDRLWLGLAASKARDGDADVAERRRGQDHIVGIEGGSEGDIHHHPKLWLLAVEDDAARDQLLFHGGKALVTVRERKNAIVITYLDADSEVDRHMEVVSKRRQEELAAMREQVEREARAEVRHHRLKELHGRYPFPAVPVRTA